MKGVRSDYFLAVRAVINREDPMCLIESGFPEDEYDPEVDELVRWRQPATAEAVAGVFQRWFNAELPAEMSDRIAAGINLARAENPGQ